MAHPARFLTLLLLALAVALLAANCPQGPLLFSQGVASGDVTSDSAVLWTRANRAATLKVEVTTDSSFESEDDFEKTVMATGATDFTVKATATGLQADTEYFYRWRQGNATSEVGRFRTAPLQAASQNVRFTFSGDSDGTHLAGVPFFNNFEVLDAVRGEASDFFIYLGDQIYSDSFVRGLAGMGPAVTLDEYRDTWRVNRSISALPDLLADTPIFSIWDDHEVVNDYDGQTVDPTRYATGRQAYFEYLPNTEAGFPSDPSCAGDPLFQIFHWGADVDVIVVDERSCRSADVEAVCLGDLAPTLPGPFRVGAGLTPAPPPGCLAAMFDPSRTMLGPVQKALFKQALLDSTATFKFIVNELPIQQLYVVPYDRWEGYAAERNEILNFIRDNAVSNVVFLATDIHANLSNEVFIDTFADPTPIASEFVAGPIARTTFAENVLAVAGPAGLANLQFIFRAVQGVECQALGNVGYGLIEVNAGTGTATISLKDDAGVVLLDDITAVPCVQTLGP